MAFTFKTSNGHEFTLALNYTKSRAIRDAHALDFVDLTGICQTFARLAFDRDLLMKVLYQLVEKQCEARGISEDAFGEGFDSGDVFQAAREALSECAINFSDPLTRDELRKALTVQEAQIKEMIGTTIEKKMTAQTGG